MKKIFIFLLFISSSIFANSLRCDTVYYPEKNLYMYMCTYISCNCDNAGNHAYLFISKTNVFFSRKIYIAVYNESAKISEKLIIVKTDSLVDSIQTYINENKWFCRGEKIYKLLKANNEIKIGITTNEYGYFEYIFNP